ncbi:MAG: hypothetical protein HOE48_13820, partial [Candidatus Latescibacteria bacterium]|nr:hypothetical protein [Candidatus Latescibacterota bacterium]
REGVKTVLYPEGNRKDITEIPADIKKKVQLVSVKHMDDVLRLGIGVQSKAKNINKKGGTTA